MKATICLLFVALCIQRAAMSQWTFVHCGPGFYELDFVNDSTGFVLALDTAGTQFVILKTIDFGTSWDTVHTASGALELTDISFPSDQVGYVSSAGAIKMLKTTDGGENWVEQDLDDVWGIGTIEFQNELDGYGGSTDGYVSYVETHDGGETWEYNFDMGVRDVSIFDDCDVLLASGGDYYSNQDCIPWFSVYPNFGDGTFSSIERASPTDIHLGGLGWNGDVTFNYGIIARSNDNGETWNFIEFPFLGGFYDIQFFGTTGFAVTENLLGNPYVDYQTIFLKTVDGGETWNYQEFTNETNCQIGNAGHISCVSEQVCYAIGSGGLFRTFNGGGELYPMPVSVAESNSPGLELTAYPIPATSEIQIESQTTISKIEICDLTGRHVGTAELNASKSTIAIVTLSNGCYFLTASLTNGNTVTIKFLKE